MFGRIKERHFVASLKKRLNSCGYNVHFNSTLKISHPENMSIGDNVYINNNCALFCGGGLSVGSVVTHDVPAMAVVGGNPARVLNSETKRFAKS